MEEEKKYKIGNFIGNLDDQQIIVELLGPEDPEGKIEQQKAYLGIEITKTLHRRLVRSVERLARLAFEKKVREIGE